MQAGGRALDVVGLGECSIDQACRVEALPLLGGKAAMLAYAERPGGTVATALLACSRLGLRARFLGSVGDDRSADTALAPLREAGIDVSQVRIVPGCPTRRAVILVEEKSGERTVLGHRDPRLQLRPGDLPPGAIEAARALLLDAEDLEAGLRAAHEARSVGIPIVLDADTPVPEVEKLLTQVDFPLVSHTFAERFSQSGSPRETLERLVSLGARLAVVTLGERGALAREGEREFTSAAFAVEPTDTTGAGDAFHAGFIWALLEGLDAEGALRAANATAALSCLGPGAQGALPSREQLERFLSTKEGRA
jgi:sulfofructose kinase